MGRPARSAQRRPVTSGATRYGATMPATNPGALLQAAVSHHQAGRFAEAEQLYRQVLAVQATQPDALHLLGVLAYQVGRPDAAVPLIEQAIAQRPSAPSFRLNLGNALLALGRHEDAVAAYRQAAALAPNDPEAYYNLGNALIQADDLAAGIASLRRTLKLRPDHADAQYNLANALRAHGQPDEAISAYHAAIRLRPAFADGHGNLGIVLHELGRHEEAARAFSQALAIQPGHPNALRGLAGIEQEARRHDRATQYLAQLVAADPDDLQAHAHLASSQLATGQHQEALAAVVEGLRRAPLDRQLLWNLAEALQQITTPIDGATAEIVRAGLLTLATEDTFDVQRLEAPIGRLIGSAPEYPGLLAAVRAGIDPLAAGLPLPASLTDEPAVIAALPRMVIRAPELELILTALRRSVLLQMVAEEPPHPAAGLQLPWPFLCALAGAAFLTEYAWLVEPDEAERLDAVRALLSDILADSSHDPVESEPLLLLTALYGRLGLLPGAERLADVPQDRWSLPFAQVVREQVQEPLEERRLIPALPRITPIDDVVSLAVQAMYEENPYPRWRSARFHASESLTDRFRMLCPGEPVPCWPEPLPVLVAGAGTGQHPIKTALRLPDADVLAVDLSSASLGYATRMAGKFGVSNLHFAQADILALGVLEQRFALIECAGVLHHLADPLAGWAVLRRLLRPDGLMFIALYSERARASVVAARALLADQAIPSTPDGIRAARRQIINLPAGHPSGVLTQSPDFYSQSGFRDLAMHVQEHRFTIPQLAASLEALDLRFLGFEAQQVVREGFQARFPTPGADLDLACWEAFEAEHPQSFGGMYQFWCRPR